MLRLGLGFVLAGLVAATQAAGADEDFVAPRLNLLTTQFVHSGTHFLPPYQFSAGVVLPRAPDTAPIEAGLGSLSRLPSVAKPQPETARTANIYWQQASDSDRVSLPNLLRIEFKVRQANIIFRPGLVLIEGDRLKITFRAQSALIEGERLKIMLQPHAASMLWRKAF